MSPALSYVTILLAVSAAFELTSGARRLRREDVPQDLRCPSDKWAHFRSKCYLIEDDRKLSLTEAKTSCLRMDASLVDVETKAEHVFLTTLLDKVEYRDSRDQLWTGGYRDGIRWKWGYQLPSKNKDEVTTTETNEYIPVTVDYWLPNEPDTAANTGMIFSFKEQVWGWEDAATASHHLFICEKEKTQEGCSSPWTEYINSCYYFAKNVRKAQPEAKEFCIDKGGNLVAINSILENTHLTELLQKPGTLKNATSYWIGGERINGDGGTFAWDISKHPASMPHSRILNTATNKPEYYMTLEKVNSDWYMSETHRNRKLQFICELALQLTNVNQIKLQTCPGNYTAIGNACYLVYKNLENRVDASATCAKDGGTLFSVDTEKELLLVSMLLDDTFGIGKKLWVGGISVNGGWVWSRDYKKFLGKPNQFVAWDIDNPNNWLGKEVKIIYKKKDGEWKWNDHPANNKYGFSYSFGYICEKGAKPYEKEERNYQCKKDIMGRNYVGKINTTRRGLACQRWDKKQPNSHSFNNVEYFPDPASGGVSGIDNYCRNPDKSPEGPWCFIGVVGEGRRETCNVPMCEDPDSVTSDCITPGIAYIGKINTTVSGKACQRWDKQTPHVHTTNMPNMFPDPSVSDAANYCRVPVGVIIDSKKVQWGMPWCIMTESSEDGSTVEACDVPICAQIHTLPNPNPTLDGSGQLTTPAPSTAPEVVEEFACPEGFILFEKQCYHVKFTTISRSSAIRKCEEMGAKLVKIETKPVFSFITKYIDRRSSLLGRQQYWTGGERVGLKWTWNAEILKGNSGAVSMNSVPVTYSDWRPGEPNNNEEKAIALKYSGGYWGWNDIYTSNRIVLRYICEKPKSDSEGCPSPWKQFEDSCYYFSATRDGKQHGDAKKACRDRYSHLVAINSAAENAYIESQVDKLKPSTSRYELWWTGGERNDVDEFVWDTTIKESGPYSKWQQGQPSSSWLRGDDYMMIEYDSNKMDWYWSHTRYTVKLNYICKLPLVSEYLQGTNRAVCPTTCNQAYKYKDACYCPSDFKRTWLDAQIACMRQGGRLVSIRNAAEMNAIIHNLLVNKVSELGTKLWTGGIPIDGKWAWSEDYAKFTVIPDQYAKWQLGEPNNSGGYEKYILLNRDFASWAFNDDRDYARANLICQRDAQVKPSVASTIRGP